MKVLSRKFDHLKHEIYKLDKTPIQAFKITMLLGEPDRNLLEL